MPGTALGVKSALAVATAAAVIVGGGAAWAFWSIGGRGNATATAGTVVELRATGHPDSGTPLHPGARSDLLVTVYNDNKFPVNVDRIRAGAAEARPDEAHKKAGCGQSGVALGQPVYSITLDIKPESSANVLLPSAVRMNNASDSACQGATFTLSLTLTGRSNGK